jgi:hypothetical protein
MRERIGERPLSYSRWHRTIASDNRMIHDAIQMIDVDGLEYCRWCKAPLALIETAIYGGPHSEQKSYEVMLELARVAEIPAYVMLYEIDEDAEDRARHAHGKADADVWWARCITSFRVRQVHPCDDGEYVLHTPRDVENMLIRIHIAEHGIVCSQADAMDSYLRAADFDLHWRARSVVP